MTNSPQFRASGRDERGDPHTRLNIVVRAVTNADFAILTVALIALGGVIAILSAALTAITREQHQPEDER